MKIKTNIHEYFLIFLLFNLISCSSLDSVPEFLPKVYKIDIQQGNEITSEMLMKLKPGMTKSQVRFVLGTPLIQDTFHQERWDYVYVMRIYDVLVERRHVVLNFEDEKLKNISGEVIPKEETVDEIKPDQVIENNKNLQLDEKKGNNEPKISDEEIKSSQEENLSPLTEDLETESNEEPAKSIDTSDSINEAIKQDIIDSLPEKDDPGYFDLLLEKIGF
ncbi:outer membrane protein assembly factor BamE [Nitrosomonadales bacterium]|nr:outer membrane protein assembly factor BamE [Nitrosomonadales bacterium]